jgi:Rod binding domain-containing protein
MADPIPAVPAPAVGATARSGAQPTRLHEAAERFEAMVLAQMLQPMFATVDLSKGPFGGRQGEAMWQPLLVEEMARVIARTGGLGIADAAFRELQRAAAMQTAMADSPPGAPRSAP